MKNPRRSEATAKQWEEMTDEEKLEWLTKQREGMKRHWAGISLEQRQARARKAAETRRKNQRKAKD
jgi:hypothetical protein